MIQLLTATTTKDERDRDVKVGLLPVGSFEQHGDHLPLITDTVVACAIANEVAKLQPVMVLPPITVSCSHEHAAWRGTVSISSDTLSRVVADIADSVRSYGIEHLVLVNGHGGNYVLSNVVQEYTATHGPVMTLFPRSSQWDGARQASGMETDSHADMHAGELEISVLLAIAPELVRDGFETGDWTVNDRTDLLTLGMSAYTKSGVIGKPSLGTASKGRDLLASLAKSLPGTRPDRLTNLLPSTVAELGAWSRIMRSRLRSRSSVRRGLAPRRRFMEGRGKAGPGLGANRRLHLW